MECRQTELHASLVSLDEWDALLSAFPDRSVFHTRSWLDLLASAFRLEPIPIAVRDQQKNVALWPVLSLRKGPFRILGSPLPGWGTPYLGPLFLDPASSQGACAAVLKEPVVRRASYFECRVIDPSERITLADFGFRRLLRFETYLLALARTEEELWAGCDSKCRNMVRKGQKKGFEVREELDSGFINDFWKMSVEVFGHWNLTPPYTLNFLELLWLHMRPSGRLCVLSSFLEGNRAATAILLHDDQTMYYWGGAAFDRYRSLSPNNALLWEAIRLANGMGLRTFDFVSSSGTAGKFKKSFGPEAVTFATHWGRSRTFVEGMMKNLYAKYLMWKRRSRPAEPVGETGETGETGEGATGDAAPAKKNEDEA